MKSLIFLAIIVVFRIIAENAAKNAKKNKKEITEKKSVKKSALEEFLAEFEESGDDEDELIEPEEELTDLGTSYMKEETESSHLDTQYNSGHTHSIQHTDDMEYNNLLKEKQRVEDVHKAREERKKEIQRERKNAAAATNFNINEAEEESITSEDFNLAAIKHAVIMSEILGPCKALKEK